MTVEQYQRAKQIEQEIEEKKSLISGILSGRVSVSWQDGHEFTEADQKETIERIKKECYDLKREFDNL